MESSDLELKMNLNRLWAKKIFFLIVGMILFIIGVLSSILYSMVQGGMYPPPTPYPMIGVAIIGVIMIDIGIVIQYQILTKKNVSRRSKSIAAIIIVMAEVVLMVALISGILYILSLTPPPPPELPQIGTASSSDAHNWTWTITAFSTESSVLKSDVYVQLRNASGIYVIPTSILTSASGTHGFNYTPALGEEYLSVGDVFSLSKDYTVGCTITLVTDSATQQYCVLTVQ
jgi:magnesium-transporting ATPase (P-type)